MFEFIIQYFLLIIPCLLAVAFLTLIERKLLSFIQRRQGPNKIGIVGLLQPFADALKLLLKEFIHPFQSNEYLFILAPLLTFILSLLGWVVIPLNSNFSLIDLDLGILYIFCISSLNIYGIIIAGWSSNSHYSFLGALRSSIQMISYEISIGFILLTIILPVNSFNLIDIVYFQTNIWFIISYFPNFLMFFISLLAELNRPPFDLPEAEAELVSGYNVEYSGIGFAFFFIGEYMNIIYMSSLSVILYFGGWSLPLFLTPKFFEYLDLNVLYFIQILVFIIKISLIINLIIFRRASLPRYRYDQLMFLGWKILLPLSITYYFIIYFILYFFNSLPIF